MSADVQPSVAAPDWTGAACTTDPDLWFPKSTRRGFGAKATADWATPRALCLACPVVTACREWALSDPDPTRGEGLWGALDPTERDQHRQSRRTA